MRYPSIVLGLALAAAGLSAHAGPPAPPLVKFNGAIGVDPLTAAGGVDVSNVVRGIAPGGRAWVMRKLKATVGTDGRITVQGAGLLFASGDLIGTRGPVSAVAATLACGPADATARLFTSPSAALDLSGNFRIDGALSEDGSNPAVMPSTCDNPALLVRLFNTTTQAAGPWFAAGIPVRDDD
jgi:hypothetical protein